MEDQLSRRELLKKTVAGVSTAALFHAARWPASPSAASESAVAPASAGPANGSFVECQATAEMGQPIKSIAAILRGVPRGKVSVAGGNFFDPKDNELLFGYPFGGGSLFVAGGMDSPVLIIESREKEYFFLSTLLKEVRASRFYLQPGEKGYRVELIHEREGWAKANRIESPVWRVGRAESLEAAYRPHFEHVEKAFAIPNWESRADVPAWFREVALVISLHGMHWTGYIFNDFAKSLKTLEWVATQIPARQVLVFLPAWDGRYYRSEERRV